MQKRFSNAILIDLAIMFNNLNDPCKNDSLCVSNCPLFLKLLPLFFQFFQRYLYVVHHSFYIQRRNVFFSLFRCSHKIYNVLSVIFLYHFPKALPNLYEEVLNLVIAFLFFKVG